jgi:hypothetical protein
MPSVALQSQLLHVTDEASATVHNRRDSIGADVTGLKEPLLGGAERFPSTAANRRCCRSFVTIPALTSALVGAILCASDQYSTWRKTLKSRNLLLSESGQALSLAVGVNAGQGHRPSSSVLPRLATTALDHPLEATGDAARFADKSDKVQELRT